MRCLSTGQNVTRSLSSAVSAAFCSTYFFYRDLNGNIDIGTRAVETFEPFIVY